ncbi:MAG TPA: inositol monophosphatase family protein [Streptosporangiaceae bacterium]|nr:inositol monophosphatase family protein [Streptosporangiaceae bacterium]
MTDLDTLLAAAWETVEAAVRLLHASGPGQVFAKADRDMVSELDLSIERQVRQHLQQLTPGIGFLGEEEGQHGPTDNSWVLDPIDGTANFLRNLPLCGVSLALVRDNRPVLGIIALPFLNSTYWAADGLGAWRNQVRITSAATATLNQAIVAIGDYAFGSDAAARNPPMHSLHHALAAKVQRVRMLGSAAADLAWAADGTLDASITIGNNPWDVAAGAVIARQAGAEVLDIDGTAHHLYSAATIAVTPGIRAELLETIQRALPQSSPAGRAPRKATC